MEETIMQANDPNRCQAITQTGQCSRQAVEGCDKCEVHGGRPMEALKAYLVTCKYLGDSPNRHLAVNELKSLREEIALSRSMIETRLNMVNSEAEFISTMPVFQTFMQTIEKLVVSCHNMEVKLDQVLNKSAMIRLAQDIIKVITTNLEGVEGKDELIEKIANEVIQAVLKASNE
jgi:hypothetical protein